MDGGTGPSGSICRSNSDGKSSCLVNNRSPVRVRPSAPYADVAQRQSSGLISRRFLVRIQASVHTRGEEGQLPKSEYKGGNALPNGRRMCQQPAGSIPAPRTRPDPGLCGPARRRGSPISFFSSFHRTRDGTAVKKAGWVPQCQACNEY